METQKTKVKGLDVLLQVLIAIFSLAWIGLYVTYIVTAKSRLRELGYDYSNNVLESVRTYPDRVVTFFIGLIFSVIVFVFVAFLFRKVTVTVVRGLFTFSFVVLMIQFYNYLCVLLGMIRTSEIYRYRYGYGNYLFVDFSKYDVTVMLLALLMLCFSVIRQKQSGMFVGQVICLVLMTISDTLGVVSVINDYAQVYPNVIYVFDYFAMWCFYLMLALLSIWLRRRNYFRAQEECTETACPCGSEIYVPEVKVVPVTVTVPVAVEEGTAAIAIVTEAETATMTRTKEEPEVTVAPVAEDTAFGQEMLGATLSEEPTEVKKEDEQKVSVPMEYEEDTVTFILTEPEQDEVSVIQEEVASIEEKEPVVQEKTERRCMSCGAVLEEGDLFCCECGTKVVE